MYVELASCPTPAKAAVRRRFGWPTLLLGINLIAVLAVAIVLRAWRLGNIPGLNGDEAWLGVQAMHLVSGQPNSWQAVSWWTPTGNPVNPFYLSPLAALHLFLDPSVLVLRIPAMLSGLALLGVNFWLSSRVFGLAVAWVSTLLLAVLPLNIAYSRFAWDASQSVLATTLVMYLALRLVSPADGPRRSLLPPFLAYVAAIWIHPTNVFAGWLLFVPAAYCYRGELQAALARLRTTRPAVRDGLLLGLGLGVFGVLTAVWVFRSLLLVAVARAVDPAQWGLFLRRLVQLFSGSTVFEFIVGPSTETTALDGLDVIFCCVATAAGFGLLQVLRDPTAIRQRCLALGSLATAISFYLIAGPAAIAPHFERYGACLIAPGVAVLAVGLSYWLAPERRCTRLTAAAICILAWLALGAFGWRYFTAIERSGGDSHLAFRTAAEEPKQAAWDYIARHSEGRPVVVVADSWWLYWPLAYLSAGRPETRVVHSDEIEDELVIGHLSHDIKHDLGAELWRIDFCESAAQRQTEEWLCRRRQKGRTTVVTDYSGRPLLSLELVHPDSTAN